MRLSSASGSRVMMSRALISIAACSSRTGARDARRTLAQVGDDGIVPEPFDGGDRGPSQATANVMQERAGEPSIRTVQARTRPCSQPMCVPVRKLMAAQKVREMGAGSIVAPTARPLIVQRKILS